MEQRQQELQFLGFFGIFKESLKIIFSKPKLFTQITLTFILPLSIIIYLHRYFSYASRHLTYSLLLEFSYYLLILIPSLFATSAVVCAITFLCSAKDVTFWKIWDMLPKIWKRVMSTFALSFAIDFCYGNLLERYGILMLRSLFPEQVNPEIFLGKDPTEIVTTKSIIGTVLVFLYMAIYVYISIIRNLATTVSVIEDLSGIKAMIKSMNLIKGTIGVAVFMWLTFAYCFTIINGRIYSTLLGPYGGHVNWRNGIGITFSILLESMVTLLSLVIGTIIYFSSKSREVTMIVLTTQSHETNFKSIWWNELDLLTE